MTTPKLPTLRRSIAVAALFTLAAAVPLSPGVASADSDVGWRLVTSFDYSATFADSAPTAHVPATGVQAGMILPFGMTLDAVARMPLVLTLAHGRFDVAGSVGYEVSLWERSGVQGLLGVRAEGGYTWAFSDIQEGYLRGPNAVEYSGPYGRGAVELALSVPLLPGTALDRVTLGLVAGGSGVSTADGARAGFDLGVNVGFGF